MGPDAVAPFGLGVRVLVEVQRAPLTPVCRRVSLHSAVALQGTDPQEARPRCPVGGSGVIQPESPRPPSLASSPGHLGALPPLVVLLFQDLPVKGSPFFHGSPQPARP